MTHVQWGELPEDGLIHRVQPAGPAREQLPIPDGFEAVIMRGSQLSSPYRPGDQIPVAIQQEFRAGAQGAQASVFLCRKRMTKSLLWGCGDIRTAAGQTIGASGSLLVYVSNARLLVRRFAQGQEDVKRIRQQVELAIAGILKQGLRLAAAEALSPDESLLGSLNSRLPQAIKLPLYEAGLGLIHLQVEDLLVS